MKPRKRISFGEKTGAVLRILGEKKEHFFLFFFKYLLQLFLLHEYIERHGFIEVPIFVCDHHTFYFARRQLRTELTDWTTHNKKCAEILFYKKIIYIYIKKAQRTEENMKCFF
ncbi:hypothetical protein Btru_065444 [Bulinus truncatus]|nr:hypothetical protein Btru_065444 [Bulinus truncatus]